MVLNQNNIYCTVYIYTYRFNILYWDIMVLQYIYLIVNKALFQDTYSNYLISYTLQEWIEAKQFYLSNNQWTLNQRRQSFKSSITEPVQLIVSACANDGTNRVLPAHRMWSNRNGVWTDWDFKETNMQDGGPKLKISIKLVYKHH